MIGIAQAHNASSNNAIDIPAQGKAMVEAAAWLQGQLIFEESELRGLEHRAIKNQNLSRADRES